MELYSLNKLEEFGAAFDVEEYKNHLFSKIARELAMDLSLFTTDILMSMKQNNVHIPILTYFKKYLFLRYFIF